MTPKDQGIPKIDRFCVVLLFEADANILFKILWSKRLIFHAEKYKLIFLNQYRGCTRRDFSSAAIHKKLITDNAYQLNYPLSIVSNDLKGCYDRIIAVITNLIYHSFSMFIGFFLLLTTPLHNQQHYIWTSHGTSNIPYVSNPNNILDSASQGGGHAGPFWTVISAILLSLFKNVCPPFPSPLQKPHS